MLLPLKLFVDTTINPTINPLPSNIKGGEILIVGRIWKGQYIATDLYVIYETLINILN